MAATTSSNATTATKLHQLPTAAAKGYSQMRSLQYSDMFRVQPQLGDDVQTVPQQGLRHSEGGSPAKNGSTISRGGTNHANMLSLLQKEHFRERQKVRKVWRPFVPRL